MVDIDITPLEVVIRPRGLHKLWAFKREVRIPRSQLRRVDEGITAEARFRLSRSLRLPGTAVPSVITAGSYRCDGRWAFWDVVGKGAKAITMTTEGHHYVELVVDVDSPRAALDALRGAMGPTVPGTEEVATSRPR